MMIVRAKAAGVWRTVPQTPPRDWEKTMAMVLPEFGHDTWCVDHLPVRVFPGLVISFLEKEDAQWFIDHKRASLPIFETGMEIVFHNDKDALYFVGQGLAEQISPSMTYEEMLAMFADMQKRAEAEAAGEGESGVYFEGDGVGGGGGNSGDKVVTVRGRGKGKRAK